MFAVSPSRSASWNPMCLKGLLLQNPSETPRPCSRNFVTNQRRRRSQADFLLMPNGTELECLSLVVLAASEREVREREPEDSRTGPCWARD